MPSSTKANGNKQSLRSCKNAMTRFQRVHHTLTRKRFPILGRIIDFFNSVPPSVRLFCLLLFVLWKVYVVYIMMRFLLSISSSFKLDLLKESSITGGDKNYAIDHASSTFSFLSGIFGIYNSHHEESIRDQVSENGGSNDNRDVHLPTVIKKYHDNPILPNITGDGEISSYLHQPHNKMQQTILKNEEKSKTPLRVLHIVTALTDFNNGRRGTIEGEDRLQKIMIPVLVDSVSTMISPPYNYQVDVYLILGWKLIPERRRLIEDALPEGVGLEIWDDASPLGYDANEDVTIKQVTRGLARQHRFVIKDKIDYYDLFSVFEDDMRITGQHISHYLELTAELKKLYDEAPDSLPDEPQGGRHESHGYRKEYFHGPLSKVQLVRMMPGFLRVEVLLDEQKWPSEEKPGQHIPVDLTFEVKNEYGATIALNYTFDPMPCCNGTGISGLPAHPTHDQIMLWESSILGVNVRKLPKSSALLKPEMLDWVLLQSGPMKPYFKDEKFVGGYWSGRDGSFGTKKDKPDGYAPKYFGQQGGWMATREQLFHIHHEECVPGFFPPFDLPAFKEDGLIYQSVEFWSGGIQLFSGRKSGCNMQRIVSLHPDHFAKHFLYHTANNKQQKYQMPRDRIVKVDNLYGQINSVVKAAKRAMESEKDRPHK